MTTRRSFLHAIGALIAATVVAPMTKLTPETRRARVHLRPINFGLYPGSITLMSAASMSDEMERWLDERGIKGM